MRVPALGGFLVCVAVLLTGGTERADATEQRPLAVESPIPGTAKPPLDVQELPVRVDGGRFSADIYSAQTGPTVIVVMGTGGPYTLSVDSLVQPAPLAANAVTRIELTAPQPGEFTMRLAETGDTAVLNVRPVGRR